MDIDLKTEGFKESKRILDDLTNAISSDIGSLIEQIIKTAKEICNDPDCKKIKRVNVTSKQNEILANIEFVDNSAIDCMIQAIRKYLPDMPEGIKQIFEAEIKRLESMKQ